MRPPVLLAAVALLLSCPGMALRAVLSGTGSAATGAAAGQSTPVLDVRMLRAFTALNILAQARAGAGLEPPEQSEDGAQVRWRKVSDDGEYRRVVVGHPSKVANVAVAIKTFNTRYREHRMQAERESEILARVQGPNVVTHYRTVESPLTTSIIMEAASGDVLGEVVERAAEARSEDGHSDDVPFDAKIVLLVDLLQGLQDLAQCGFVHRDIKPENLLVFGDCRLGSCHLKISDFGLACNFDGDGHPCEEGISGTALYTPPEVWQGGPDGPERDVWAAGLVMYEMLVGELPEELLRGYEDSGNNEEFGEFIAEEFQPAESDYYIQEMLASDVPQIREFAHLLGGMLLRDPSQRVTAEVALVEASAIARARGLAVPEPRRSTCGGSAASVDARS